MGSRDQRVKAEVASADRTAEVSWLRTNGPCLTIAINARPGSRRRGFLRSLPTGPVIGLLSVAEKGRANRELIDFVAEILDVPGGCVSIIKGHGTRQKVLRVETSMPSALAARFRRLVDQT